MFTKLGEKIKDKRIRSIFTESFVYSRLYGVGGVFGFLAIAGWKCHSGKKQYARILSHHAEAEKWNQKISDRARKTILDYESIKTAMLVQTQVHKPSTRAYQGEVLVLVLEEEKEEKEDLEKEEEKGGGGYHLALPHCTHPHHAFIPPKPVGAHPFLSPAECLFSGSMIYYMPQFFYVPQMTIINQAPWLPLVDPSLPPSMVKQIEYYFSDANLVKDDFLRSKMDEEGWVPVELISNFPSVKKFIDAVQVTDAVQFIVCFLRASALVEVQDKKVRRRGDWRKWIHTSGQFAADATEVTDAQVEVASSGSLSDKSTNQS